MANENWKKQEAISNIWKPTDEGQEISGLVVEVKEGQYGTQLYLNVNDEEVITPSHKQLQTQLTEIKKGDTVKIVYLGSKPSGKGNDTRMYEVYVRTD